ncbi:DUF3552 domain-containing protein [Candidatus Peregrinibacteria bacterium]|nr:DUF3552 domain-containing protein [Candidatus Peregrinibacteria bacterium]
MSEALTVTLIILGAAAGIPIGFFILKQNKEIKLSEYQEKADKKIEEAKTEIHELKADIQKRKSELKEKSIKRETGLKEQYKRLEKLIASKDEQMRRREAEVNEMRGYLKLAQKEVDEQKKLTLELKEKYKENLAKRAGMNLSEAKDHIFAELDKDLAHMKEDRMARTVEVLEEDKKRHAKDLLVYVIQKYAKASSVERRSWKITVKRDEQKAKIIGENAKILQTLEEISGCEIIFNDAPNTINVSCLDIVKKKICFDTIKDLLNERNVTEERVKNIYEQKSNNIDKHLYQIGKETINKLELNKRKYSEDFVKIMGRLYYRTSYGQNVMEHSFEVGYFTLMLGAELGLDLEKCRIAGFFHDLGKAIDHEVGEPHDVLTKKIMEKEDFTHEEIHAAWNHHDAVPHESPEAMLVKAADALSASRPGARQESLEKFLEHIRMMDDVANSYEGVKKTLAMAAGRELRVLTDPSTLDDENLAELAERIANEIHDQKTYPGKIKINVIRRTNTTSIANKGTVAPKKRV